MIERTSRETVIAFWKAMASNDFASAALWLAGDVICDWPQSGERIVGRQNFADVNTAYPAAGLWRFDIRRIVAEGHQVVTSTEITDGTLTALAITFHDVEDGLISRQVEYWPDPYPAPDWRRPWVIPIPAKAHP